MASGWCLASAADIQPGVMSAQLVGTDSGFVLTEGPFVGVVPYFSYDTYRVVTWKVPHARRRGKTPCSSRLNAHGSRASGPRGTAPRRSAAWCDPGGHPPTADHGQLCRVVDGGRRRPRPGRQEDPLSALAVEGAVGRRGGSRRVWPRRFVRGSAH